MFVFWMFGRIGNKKTLTRPNASKYLLTTFILYLSYALLFIPPLLKFYSFQIIFDNLLLNLFGVVICLFGVFFAIWSRLTLGKNWSGITATQKEGHELVTTGPYRFVRHPIYFGFILSMIGFALTTGTVLACFAVLVGLTALILRVYIEEKLMNKMFPVAYQKYSNQVKRLVPFLW